MLVGNQYCISLPADDCHIIVVYFVIIACFFWDECLPKAQYVSNEVASSIYRGLVTVWGIQVRPYSDIHKWDGIAMTPHAVASLWGKLLLFCNYCFWININYFSLLETIDENFTPLLMKDLMEVKRELYECYVSLKWSQTNSDKKVGTRFHDSKTNSTSMHAWYV